MKYSSEQIFGIFDHKSSGIKSYLEAGDAATKAGEDVHYGKKLLPPTPDQMDATPTREEKPEKKQPEDKTPKYEKVSIKKGDEEYEISVDIVNDKTYINDELVTNDTPKELLDILKDALPKAIKRQQEKSGTSEEMINEANDVLGDDMKNLAYDFHDSIDKYFPQDDEEFIFTEFIKYYRKNYLR